MRPAGAIVIAGLWALLGGCRRDEPPVLTEEQAHTLEKLRHEVDRQNAARDPNARLAELAARPPPPAAGERPLPAKLAPVDAGPVRVTLTSVHAAHQVSGGKLSVTSEDWFVRVTLQVENLRQGQVPVNFSLVTLSSADGEHPIARDAQRLAGTRELDRALQPGLAEPVVLHFEVPAAALGAKGAPLTLNFPPAFAGGGAARLPIE